MLSAEVTLKPGERRFHVRYRVDNPTPLRRSNRLWVNHILYTHEYDAKHILYPVGYISQHWAPVVSPFWGEGQTPNWYVNTSHFALYPDHPFCGVWLPKDDVNVFYNQNLQNTPGMKLYTPPSHDSFGQGFMELWLGTSPVFEDNGWFLDPYEPIVLESHYWLADGIGRAAWSNADLALGMAENKARFTVAVAGPITVSDGSGRILGSKHLAVGEVLETPKADRLVVKRGERILMDEFFPLRHTDTRPRLAEIKPRGGSEKYELDELSPIGKGHPSAHSVIPTAKGMLEKKVKKPESFKKPSDRTLLSWENTVYRFGRLDLSQQLLDLMDEPSPEADHLKGLMAWEKKEKVDFGRAGLDAHYHRSLLALAQGDLAQAKTWLLALVQERPRVWRPRVMLAHLGKDRARLKELLDENPAGFEALWALAQLGDDQAKSDLDRFTAQAPSLQEHLEAFVAETQGQWKHLSRFQPLLD